MPPTPTPKWQTTAIPGAGNLRNVFFINADKGWVVGDNGFLARTTNSGTDWLANPISGAQNLKSVCFIDENNGWSADDAGNLYYTGDGSNWSFKYNFPFEIKKIYFKNINRGFVMGKDNIFRTNDGGNTWNGDTMWNGSSIQDKIFYDLYPDPADPNAFKFLSLALSLNMTTPYFYPFIDDVRSGESTGMVKSRINGTCILDLNNIWMVGDSGFILHYTYNPVNGEISDDLGQYVIPENLNAVYFFDPIFGIAVGNGGIILNHTSGGNWGTGNIGLPNDLNGVYIVKGQGNEYITWIVGNSGLVAKSIINI
jgi:photosystem II stability/assembly factor-like uncharacterized protein